MYLRAAFCKHTLNFKFEAGTSRGVLNDKDSFFIKIWDEDQPEKFGIGEAGPLKGLSIDFETAEEQLERFCDIINESTFTTDTLSEKITDLTAPSVVFAVECALLQLKNDGKAIFKNDFSSGSRSLHINGLIWMGDVKFMLEQIEKKLSLGFDTLKLKIGAKNIDGEIAILRSLRKEFNADRLCLRVDANGAFHPNEAPEILRELHKLSIHSIEQPISIGQWDAMARLCRDFRMPIALDEELIGQSGKSIVLETIKPAFAIFKPTLLGGVAATREWVNECERLKIGWWMTSALESNIGLNAIAQFTAEFQNKLPSGLGTGQLYHNNIDSPLTLEGQYLRYDPQIKWKFKELEFSH